MGPPAKNKRRLQTPPGSGRRHENTRPLDDVAQQTQQHVLDIKLQQTILNVFSTAFPILHDDEQVKQLVQEVKGHLYNRDFPAAFSKNEYLQVYALRWSAARALGYADIFCRPERLRWFQCTDPVTVDTMPDVEKDMVADPNEAVGATTSVSVPSGTNRDNAPKVVCIGGGAGAEIVGLAAASRPFDSIKAMELVAVDMADWNGVLDQLVASLHRPSPLSAHASEVAKRTNQALVSDPGRVKVSFTRKDVLESDEAFFCTTFSDVTLCTIMFTLNELFSTSMAKTTAFLLKLTDLMQTGAWLVVVDSPGSYSEVKLGKQGSSKKYPMKWLLDHTLLDVAGKRAEARWSKTEEQESMWFRIDKTKLKYALDLENMRYQIHVYRRK